MSTYLCDLVLEVTRRCNDRCEHCLRGPARPVNMNPRLLAQLVQNLDITYIGSVTLSGGEPSLVPELIASLRKVLARHKVEVGSFYCATNGLNNSREFVTEMLEWYLFCTDNEISAVRLSSDRFHKPVRADRLYLNALKFFSVQETPLGASQVLREGRALPWGERAVREDCIVVEEKEEHREVLEGTLYLNALGELIAGCDWSYVSQKRHMIGRSSDPDLWEKIRAFSGTEDA